MLNVREASQRLRVSPSLIYTLCTRGKIAHERYGLGRGTIRIREDALNDFQNRCKVRPGLTGFAIVHPSPRPPLRHIKLDGG